MTVNVQFSPQRFPPPAAAAAELNRRVGAWTASDLQLAGRPRDGMLHLHVDAGGYRFECVADAQAALLVVLRWEALPP